MYQLILQILEEKNLFDYEKAFDESNFFVNYL